MNTYGTYDDDKAPYCSFCGRIMEEGSRPDGYDTRTGKPVTKYYWVCPLYYKKGIFDGFFGSNINFDHDKLTKYNKKS